MHHLRDRDCQGAGRTANSQLFGRSTGSGTRHLTEYHLREELARMNVEMQGLQHASEPLDVDPVLETERHAAERSFLQHTNT